MSKLTDRVSYLKGMAAGLKLDPEQDTNRLLLEMLDLLGDIADEIEEVEDDLDELDEYVESIDDDLADLEETLFGEEDEHHCHCGECDDDDDEDYEDEEDDDVELIAYACPHCGEELEFNAADVDFDEDYLCPKCFKPVFPELEEDEDEE